MNFWPHSRTRAAWAPATGWTPHHLQIGTRAQPLVLAPLYEKAHSWGEFVFDFAWARAWQSRGLEYYPKLAAGDSLYAGHRAAPAVRGARRRRARPSTGSRPWPPSNPTRARAVVPRRMRCSSTSRCARPPRRPAGSCGAIATSNGTTAATRISRISWRAFRPTSARRRGANAGASPSRGSNSRPRPARRWTRRRCGGSMSCTPPPTCATATCPI